MTIAFASMLVVAGFLGYVYNLLIVIIPFVYLNFFITAGFGLALGYCAKFIARFSRCRNVKATLVFAFVAGMLGYYFQWVGYFSYLANSTLSFEAYLYHVDLIFYPTYVADFIGELNRVGAWEFFHVPFKGFALTIVWILEFGMIVCLCLFIVYKHPVVPYSELLQQLYRKQALNYQFASVTSMNNFRENMAQDVVATIVSQGYGTANRYAQVSIFYLKDEAHQYLSVDNISVGRTNGKATVTPVVTLQRIATADANMLIDKFGAHPVFMLDY